MPRRPGAVLPPDPVLPSVHLARDHDRSAVAAHVRTGRWIRIRPGAYVDAALLDGSDGRRRRELARIAAVTRQLRLDHVVSHESAALLRGLPLLRTPSTAHVIQATSPHARCSPDLVRHVVRLPSSHRAQHLGVPTTTLERTLVDCATAGSASSALVVADAALHRGADRDACAEMLRSMPGHRGVAVARAVLEAADDGAESPGETLTRLALLRDGLIAPTTQVPIATPLGTFWGDLGWPAWRVLVEYDGRQKYDIGRDALLAEKRREDALREAGWVVIRVVAEDLRTPGRLAARVRAVSPAARSCPHERRPLLAG